MTQLSQTYSVLNRLAPNKVVCLTTVEHQDAPTVMFWTKYLGHDGRQLHLLVTACPMCSITALISVLAALFFRSQQCYSVRHSEGVFCYHSAIFQLTVIKIFP